MDQASSVLKPTPNHSPSGPAKRRRLWWIWAVVLLLFGLLFYWVLHQHAASQEQGGRGGQGGGGRGHGRYGMAGPVPVTMATAKLGNLGVYLNAIGTVTPVYTSTITAQVTGVITAVHYH